ncbi:hypothetical protein BST27_13720 [Mycobacterium intermedium]|uniref:DUF3043 domain-containing protein n=1 Tax=Mycobacterium intermedium TaxID=28445 RepID=A0A1E3SDX2_MYCIE|nr:DUF3043 domain-containing protein [Mycobacterium intermedium]ODQ99862.1 hypothetical protein BHQ20_15555 [Mycobacterium intermedium]ORB05020.1 hypothetical protein BST27_13720 [Mycobacterium intermedium]
MKLLGRKKDQPEGAAVAAASDTATGARAGTEAGSETPANGTARGARRTGPKGRPTPKRSEARRNAKKGPVVPAPMTAAEARARRKALKGPKLSREERRAERAESRARMTERRERMMAGEEAYLLPRDQGPVRRYVRDVVDARRNVLGLFMPSALALLFIMFAVPQLQFYISPAMMLLMLLMGVDGIILGRKVGKLVDDKFPDNTESHWKLGLYAAGRASQMRRMRAPRPQVPHGAKID